VEMLAQHMITGPAFEAIFENSSFVTQNSVSVSINKVLKAFANHHLEKEAEGLTGFYDSVKKEVDNMQEKVSGIDNILGKQKIIVELYDKFFRRAFPKMTQRLGIVYTPVEIVDFIIKSVNELALKEFGQDLGSKNLHIIDPFVGTGTFITRLLQSGLIAKKDLPYKYSNEIHANELVLLAYYIATINIESVYHEIVGGDYQPFKGICLTDTFQLYEKDDLISYYFEDNSTRRKLQKKSPIRVILGNPPYSVGQRSENDGNKNVMYHKLDQKIHDSYVENSVAQSSKGTRDSYVRAFRWASDRLEEDRDGIVAFVTNSGYIDKPSMDGLRKSFSMDFQSVYVVNLRGDIRKNSLSGGKDEGENVFGQASMTGTAIAFLVKNSNSDHGCRIYYHDIGKNLTRVEKLSLIKSFGSISGIKKHNGLKNISPNDKGDWINQRDNFFNSFIAIGDKKSLKNNVIFSNYSLGVSTNRDTWCFNFSYDKLTCNIKKTIDFYNQERQQFNSTHHNLKKEEVFKNLEQVIDNDPTKISWSRSLKSSLIHNKVLIFDKKYIFQSFYRPFTKCWLYFNRQLNEMIYQLPRLFPVPNQENIVFSISGVGARSGFSAMAANFIPALHFIDTSQCFPLYFYEPIMEGTSLFQTNDLNHKFRKINAITSFGLNHFQDFYPKLTINLLDIFHYIYGIFHSQDYRERFADNLAKELPRIPRVKKAKDFQSFVEAGKELLNLHLNYENVDKYPLEIVYDAKLTDEDYRVTQMKFKKVGSDNDLSTILYNHKITLKGIPLEAYDYVVSGKTAIAWVMKFQSVRTDKDSQIVNDANLWATETIGDPKYPLELLQRVITVSLKTLDIMKNLPKLDI
jgi:predicted helicase